MNQEDPFMLVHVFSFWHFGFFCIAELTMLSDLNIKSCYLPDSGCEKLERKCRKNQLPGQQQKVEITKCMIVHGYQDQDWFLLSSLCAGLTNLRVLNLGYNNMTDASMVFLKGSWSHRFWLHKDLYDKEAMNPFRTWVLVRFSQAYLWT